MHKTHLAPVAQTDRASGFETDAPAAEPARKTCDGLTNPNTGAPLGEPGADGHGRDRAASWTAAVAAYEKLQADRDIAALIIAEAADIGCGAVPPRLVDDYRRARAALRRGREVFDAMVAAGAARGEGGPSHG